MATNNNAVLKEASLALPEMLHGAVDTTKSAVLKLEFAKMPALSDLNWE
jgi:hypothetical protein